MGYNILSHIPPSTTVAPHDFISSCRRVPQHLLGRQRGAPVNSTAHTVLAKHVSPKCVSLLTHAFESQKHAIQLTTKRSLNPFQKKEKPIAFQILMTIKLHFSILD